MKRTKSMKCHSYTALKSCKPIFFEPFLFDSFFSFFFRFYHVPVAHLHRLMANICSMATTSQVLFAHCLQDLKTDEERHGYDWSVHLPPAKDRIPKVPDHLRQSICFFKKLHNLLFRINFNFWVRECRQFDQDQH